MLNAQVPKNLWGTHQFCPWDRAIVHFGKGLMLPGHTVTCLLQPNVIAFLRCIRDISIGIDPLTNQDSPTSEAL